MPYDPSGTLPFGQNPFASSGASQLAQVVAKAGEGYPSFTGGLDDPDWVKNLPPQYANFRRSDNIDDRRADSFLKNWGGAMLAGMANLLPSSELLKASFAHPLTPLHESLPIEIPEENPLSIALGSAALDRNRRK